ncbi:MAG: hypothetical protein V4507_16300, partial [Verrucomicrobiota bacterium]
MKNSKSKFTGLKISLIVGLMLVPSFSASIINDTFTDGGRTNGADLADMNWLMLTTTSSVAVADDSAGIGSGNALKFSTGGTFRGLVGLFGSNTQLGVGDTITVSFNYRYNTAPTSSGAGLRFGIFDDGGTPQTSDGSESGIRFNDAGYGANLNPGAAGSSLSLHKESAGDEILGGTAPNGIVNFGTAGASIVSGITSHSATLSISRDVSGLNLACNIDGLSSATGSDTSPLTNQFSYFGLE